MSVDESMIPYRGLRSAKQFIKGKPVKFNIKCGCYAVQMAFLTIVKFIVVKDPLRTGPLATHVVNTMLQPMQNNKQQVVFFDNFFTSH